MRSVGVLGLGNMGRPMATLLIDSPLVAVVNLWSRRPDAIADLITRGARRSTTLRQMAQESGLVISVLPDIAELEPLLWGEDGLLSDRDASFILAICSTSSPDRVRALERRLHEETHGRVQLVDAPLSGGTEGASSGTLSIMVGASPAEYSAIEPILHILGRPVLLGPIGSGQVAKACNQMIVAATVMAIGEATVIAARSGVDVALLMETLSRGYANSRILETRAHRFVDEDYSVSGPAKYMVKDLSYAMAEAERTGTSAAQLRTLLAEFTALVDMGLGDKDIAVTRAFVEKR